LVKFFAREFIWEKPAAALDSLPTVFNHRREKRVFYALDHYTIQKLGSSKQQTGQEWNCDLHVGSPKFPLDKSSWQGACQTPCCWNNIKISKFMKFPDCAILSA
jgi:hypothetical protein